MFNRRKLSRLKVSGQTAAAIVNKAASTPPPANSASTAPKQPYRLRARPAPAQRSKRVGRGKDGASPFAHRRPPDADCCASVRSIPSSLDAALMPPACRGGDL
jgi:hypothetical protein